MSHGLIVGRFQPPHEGHLMVARAALQLVDQLTVVVCASPVDVLAASLRQAWLAELLPAAKIVVLGATLPPDDAPPSEWASLCRQLPIAMPVTHVFGSDRRCHRLATTLGAKAVVLDPDREAVPISADRLIAAPYAHWEYLPQPIRAGLARRVCLFGPESTGKSTLARSLADHYGGSYMPEYGRIYDEQNRPEEWRSEHLVEIATTHEAMRRTLMAAGPRLLIEDTDALLTIAWSESLAGSVDPWFDEIELADLYLLTDIDVPWVPDGLRQFGDDAARQQFMGQCQSLLTSRGADYELLSGSWASREARAINVIDSMMAGDPWLSLTLSKGDEIG